VVKAFRYSPRRFPPRLNWHERLEVFMAVEGEGRFQVGSRVIPLGRGDILVVESLKYHGLLEFRGRQPRGVVVGFLPDLVYNLGSTVCDSMLLTPFADQPTEPPPVLRAGEAGSEAAIRAVSLLAECYFRKPPGPYSQAGCKVYLLELLFHLATHFGRSGVAHAEHARRRERTERLRVLSDHVDRNYAERISLAEAASLVGMSESQFTRYFKQATGMTFVEFLTHVRLNKALRLLQETALTIAEIASAVGFSDQSYFDRRFKRHFGVPPRRHREKT
jgi:AraC-like DNA-binding protein